MEFAELSDWLRLELTPSVGSATARKLLSAFGLPGSLFAQSHAALTQVCNDAQAQALLQIPAELEAQTQRTWAWLQEDHLCNRLLVLGDPDYPHALLHMEDPPLMLYCTGSATCDLNAIAGQTIAMVGSRNPTPQGLINAREFAKSLSNAGLTVVSGLALGVDSAAHEGALVGAVKDQVATIAVVGTGLDRVYPKQNFDLAHRIQVSGLLVSEFLLGTPPHQTNFPRRNRIIAGLSRGTLVVEAALKSGSLITARLASEQGKDVFAIPGSIHSTQSRGCHALIKQGAKLVESAQDILEEIGLSGTSIASKYIAADALDSGPGADFSADTALLTALGFDPSSLDVLQARTGMDTAHLQAQLMTLELGGQVQRLPGGLFQRIGRA
jgi:DNA processing protein